MVNFEKYLHNKWMTLFMYCLLIATFVTVAIYVYAGEQQDLEKRKFGNVHVQKNLQVDGTNRQNLTWTKLDSPATVTLDLDPNKTTFYEIGGSSSVTTVNLPAAGDLAKKFPKKVDGETINFGAVYTQLADGVVTFNYPGSDGINYSSIDAGTLPALTTTLKQYTVYNFNFTYKIESDGTVSIYWNHV